MKKKTPVRRTPTLKARTAARTNAAARAISPAVDPVAAPAVEAVVAVVAAPAVDITPAVEAANATDVAAFPTEWVGRLQNASAEVAVDAAAALANLGDVRTVPALVAVLENADGYCHVVTRAAAAMALGRLDSPQSVAALAVAAGDAMAEVSREAVLALGELKAVSTAERLIGIASNASGFYLPTVRHAAVRSLGRMGVASAKPMLEEIAKDAFEDASIVSAAREAAAML